MTELLKTNLPEFKLFEEKIAGGSLVTAIVKNSSVNSVMVDRENTILGRVESSTDRDVDDVPTLVVNFITKYELANHLFGDGFGTFLGYQGILGQVNFLHKKYESLPLQVAIHVVPEYPWSRLTNLLNMTKMISVMDGSDVIEIPGKIFR